MAGKGRMMNYANWPKTMFWGEVFSTQNQNSFWNSFTRVMGGWVEYALLLFFSTVTP